MILKSDYIGSYEAASTGKRLANWGTTNYSVNAPLMYNLKTLQSRARTLQRNHPLVAGACDLIVSNVIGTGINPRWKTDDAGLKSAITDYWQYVKDDLDADGQLAWGGLQGLAFGTVYISGEVLARHYFTNSGYRVQLLEPDFLDPSYTQDNIKMGIEFSSNRRVAYHLFEKHPGDMFFDSKSLLRVRIPASEISHVFKVIRPGQIRGIPWITPAILQLRDLDQYQDAVLMRKKIQNMFTGFFYRPPADAAFPTPGELDTVHTESDSGITGITMEPGTMQDLPPGYDLKFSDPPQDSGDQTWVKDCNRTISRGCKVTYEGLTGDLSDVNFSSIRAGIVANRRECKIYQADFSHQFLKPIVKNAIVYGILNGDLPQEAASVPLKWVPMAYEYVNPKDDVETDEKRIQLGIVSRSDVAEERGSDAAEVDAENAIDQERADSYGLKYSGDLRDDVIDG